MPEQEAIQFTVGRAVDSEGEIHIEGVGVVPTVDVPVDEETLFSEGDPVLEAAVAHLDEATAVEIADGGEIGIGDTVTGELAPRTRVQYTLGVAAGDVITITLGDETGEFDTYLRLYDTDGNLLAENDDAESGRHRQLGARGTRGPRGHVTRGRSRARTTTSARASTRSRSAPANRAASGQQCAGEQRAVVRDDDRPTRRPRHVIRRHRWEWA